MPKFQTSLLLDQEFLHFAPMIKLLGVVGATHGVQQPEAVPTAGDTLKMQNGIPWSEQILVAAGCTYPFIVGVTKDNVEVANLYDSKVDSIKFADGEFAFDCKGKIYIASKRSILLLTQFPIEKQIRKLIADDRVLAAMSMFEKTFQGTKKEKVWCMKLILQRTKNVESMNEMLVSICSSL